MSTVIKHSGDKAKYTFFDPAGTSWPASIKNVQDALAMIGPWAREDVGLNIATYTTPGIAALATDAEIDEGTVNNKIVTPAGLARRMLKPEATYSRMGMTQYATSTEVMQENNETRTVVPKMLHEAFTKRVASEAKSGTIKIATSTMATTGTDDSSAMTPAKVRLAISALVPSQAIASETTQGISKLATPQEALAGVGREGVAVSPYAFSKANATESKFGTARIATAAEAKQDTDFLMSTRRFRAQRASLTEVGTTQLTNTLGNANLALSGAAPVVNKAGDNMTGRLKFNGVDYITRNELNDSSVQIGFIVMSAFASSNNYGGTYMYCDGRSLNKAAYSELFARIGYTYGGSGDNFNLPNMNDMFPRGASTSRPAGRRENYALPEGIKGSCIGMDLKDRGTQFITGSFKRHPRNHWNANMKYGGGDDWGSQYVYDPSTNGVPLANENRPANMALWFVIRVK